MQKSITATELASRLKGELYGDGDYEVFAVATLAVADSRSLTWVGSPKFMPQALNSKAGILLLPHGCTPPSSRTCISVSDPDLAVCDVLELLAPPVACVEPGVHPTATVCADAVISQDVCIGAHAYVGIGATLGARTRLHPGAYVGDYAQIGEDVVLWSNVVVRERVTIGNRVTIHPNSTVGADGFGYLQRGGKHHKIPQTGMVVIEDDVEIGANSAVDRARSGVTRIGSGTKIDNLVQVGHNVELGAGCMIVSGCSIGGSAKLGRGVVLAGHVGVTDHCNIGDGVQIAAKSSVMGDITSGIVVRGIPAIDNKDFLRQQAAVRKLPRLLERFRALIKRTESLEQRADDRVNR